MRRGRTDAAGRDILASHELAENEGDWRRRRRRSWRPSAGGRSGTPRNCARRAPCFGTWLQTARRIFRRAGSSCRTRPCSAPRSGPTASGSTRARIGASSHCTGYRPTGALPAELANLMNLSRFSFNGDDGLCAPNDASFQTWLDGIDNVVGPDCTPWGAQSESAASRRWRGPILEFDAAATCSSTGAAHINRRHSAAWRDGRLFAPDQLTKWNYFTITYSPKIHSVAGLIIRRTCRRRRYANPRACNHVPRFDAAIPTRSGVARSSLRRFRLFMEVRRDAVVGSEPGDGAVKFAQWVPMPASGGGTPPASLSASSASLRGYGLLPVMISRCTLRQSSVVGSPVGVIPMSPSNAWMARFVCGP